MAILFWDLVEESPVFSDEERLRVTNAFSRQLNHRKNEGIYKLVKPGIVVGSRHGQYSAISLFCLGRYFDKDYPDPIWAQCVRGPWNHFAALEKSAWVHGESDNLFWYTTGKAPVLTWMMLSGDRKPIESGSLQILMDAQEMLISGEPGDPHLNSGAIDYWHKLAYLTGDGRWLMYRDREGVDLSVFRLGQSYWPKPEIIPVQPVNLVGKWMINPLPEPMWTRRSSSSGLSEEQSFQWGAFRSAPDGAGDYILLDGFNGASRNPYHTFAVLRLRMDGATLLSGYNNQVLTRADGMVEHQVAMDGALLHSDVIGGTAVAVGEVPKAAFSNWQRTLAQRVGKYALVMDDLTFRTDSDNIEAQILWEARGAQWNAEDNAIALTSTRIGALPEGWHGFRAVNQPCTSNPAGPSHMVPLGGINIMLLRGTEPGQWLEMPFELAEDAEGEVIVDLVDYRDRAVVRFMLDGEPVGEEYAHYSEDAATTRVTLGTHSLAAGEHQLRVEVVRKNPGAAIANIGLGGLMIKSAGASDTAAPGIYAIAPSKLVNGLRSGSVVTMQWFGAAREGEHVRFFSLIGPDTNTAPLRCYELTDQAAALALPQPALAVAGSYPGIEAELAIVASDHLYGHGLVSAGVGTPLVSASAPVEIDWDFATGEMYVVTSAETTSLMMRLAAPDAALRHVLTGVKPGASPAEALAGLLVEGEARRAEQIAAATTGDQQTTPELAQTTSAQVGEAVKQMLVVPGDDERTYVAAGQTVHVFEGGDEVQTLQTDGTIRKIHWWPEYELLLVGCDNEEVVAFNRAGERAWVFTSEMDPAVFRAAKTYWFKSAASHKGIWGVTTGEFLDGKTQAFVGSACTLEIIDEHGKLVERMAQFWGDPHVFQFVDAPDGSINLLAARRINGTHRVIVTNNQTLNQSRGFNYVPAGHTYVGGWCSMNRYHLFYEDLDGDGVKEVISEVNGSWNRVSVWDAAGTPKWDASFGPGKKATARNMRDLVIADLDGDGKQEIITCTSSGLVVALTYDCQKLWSTRLASPPNVMAAVTPSGGDLPWLVVGCDDGSVVALDGTGEPVRSAKLDSRVEDIVIAGGDEPVAVMGSVKGQVAVFAVR
jgi:outer membrane protein assembly factor BamB